MTRRDRPAAFAGAAVTVLFVLAGCSNVDEPEVPVVPTPGASDGTGTGGTPTGDATAAGPSPTSTVGVPELCSELASAGDVARILTVPMQGETRRVYNDEFLADSGRTGRLTCSYGVPIPAEGATPPPTPPPVPLSIAVSGYVDAETAAGRIDSTVDSAQASGGQVAAQTIGGRDGFLLSDAEDVSFVLAEGTRTYVITLRHGLVPPAAEKVVLVDLATHVLDAQAS